MAERLSHSKIRTFNACKRQFYWTYEENIEPKAQRGSQQMGRAWAYILEHGAQGLGEFFAPFIEDASTGIEVDDLMYQKGVVEVLERGYRNQYGGAEQREIAFEVTTPTFSSMGFIDGAYGQQGPLVEDKLLNGMFFSQASIKALRLDQQVTHYMWVARRHLGMEAPFLEYRVTIKPQIKRRTTRDPETMQQFLDRLAKDVDARPEHYFRPYRLFRSEKELDDHEAELTQIAQSIEQHRSNQWWAKNGSHCGQYGGCPFIPLCADEDDAVGLYQERTGR